MFGNVDSLVGNMRRQMFYKNQQQPHMNRREEMKGVPIQRSASARRGCTNGYYYPTPTTTGSPINRAPKSTTLFRRKLPPIEIAVECTLEELFRGCVKEVSYTRNVIDRRSGYTELREEVQMVIIKRGWKKGTTVTFEGRGNECSGGTPSDVVFIISEKDHPIFKRADSNDLVLKVKVPLVDVLTGWTLNFRLISGENVSHPFADEIIFPGYQKVIEGQGMSVANSKDKRGNLIIKFEIVFPRKLNKEQIMMLKAVL